MKHLGTLLAGCLCSLAMSGCARNDDAPDSPVGKENRAAQGEPTSNGLPPQSGEQESQRRLAPAAESDKQRGETIANTFYVTKEGSGQRIGSDWEHAASASDLLLFLSEKAAPGDQVLLGSGSYPQLAIKRSGAADRPLVIQGVDTGAGLPKIVGRWKETNPKYHAHSWTAISIASGAAHLRISGIAIQGFIYGLKSTNNRDVRLTDLKITSCREGIWLSGMTDSEIRRCHISRYTKRGIDLEAGCQELVIADVVADATGGLDDWPAEAFPFSFAIEDGEGNRNIHFENCTAKNNFFRGEPGKYWNGDGFLAENNAQNISYSDCLSLNNTDAGWDDKSASPRLVRCIAAGNKRGFRFWNVRGKPGEPARLENCLGVYNKSLGGSGSSVGLWMCGAVEAERCTFHNNGTAAVGIENHAPGGKLRAVDCILSADAELKCKTLVLKEKHTTYEAVSVAQWNGGPPEEAPNYVAPSPQWDGTPINAFNSQRYGKTKGFYYDNSNAK